MKSFYKEKLVFVTGGSEGIGRSAAIKLAQLGANVVIISRSQAKLTACMAELQKNKHSSHQLLKTVSLDVSDFEKTQHTLGGLMEEVGTPDLLLTCAGLARPGYLEALPMSDFRTMMEVNYFGTLHVVKAVAPAMCHRRSGWIVTTSSIAGFVGLFGYTGYCASKFAVIGFSQALRAELKPFNVNVGVLCPPNTRTPGLVEENRNKPKEVLATEEKAKVVEPDFVADHLLKSIPQSKFMIIPTFDGTMAYQLSRHTPWILEQIVKRPT